MLPKSSLTLGEKLLYVMNYLDYVNNVLDY